MRVVAWLLLLQVELVRGQAGTNYESMLDALWAQSDTNKDGYLGLGEFKDAASRLGITVGFASTNTLQGHASVTALYNDLDTNGNSQLTQAELAGAIDRFPQYKTPLTSAFTNGAGQVPNSVSSMMPAGEMLTAQAQLKVQMVLDGLPSAIYPGTRQQIRAFFAQQVPTAETNVIITFTIKQTSAGRRLQSGGAAQTDVNATIYCNDEATATTTAQKLPVDASSMGAIPAFSGLTVASYDQPSVVPLTHNVPDTEITIFFAALLALGVISCIAACCWSKKLRATGKLAPAQQGCCATGCCSFNAVGPWAASQLLAGLLLIGMAIFLYLYVDKAVKEVVKIVQIIINLSQTKIDALKSYRNMLPSQYVNLLQQNIQQFRMAPLAVIVPGGVAAFFTILGALCPLPKLRKGSYCCSNTMMLFASCFLLIALIFYLIMTASAAAIVMPPPSVAQYINQVRGLCVTVPATINQLLTDNIDAVNKLEAAGQDVTSFRNALQPLQQIQASVNDACVHLDNYFIYMAQVFLPAILCVGAVLHALWVNQTLCFTTGCCCKSPPIEPAKKFEPSGVVMQGIVAP